MSLPYQDYIYNMASSIGSGVWESLEQTKMIKVTPCTNEQPVNMVNITILQNT